MVEHDWRKGYPVRTIARLYRLTENQVTYRMAHVPRQPRPVQYKSKYPQLNDPSWLRVELAVGMTVAEICRKVGAQRPVVVAALRRHEIEVPPRRMPRLERAAALHDPAERAEAAWRIEEEARGEAKAASRLKEAARRQAGAALGGRTRRLTSDL